MDLSPSPSQASGRIQRIPLKSVPPKNNTSTTINDEIHLIRLRNEEEQAFVNLGNKLSAMNAVVADAKNVHKPIRDNLAQAFALYQQLRENREAIALIAVQSTNQDKYAVATVDREMQTETKIPVQDTFKRAASPTPDADRTNKKVRTADQLQSSENTESEQQWSTVENKKRRLNRKKKKKPIKPRNEAITITAGSSSYAEILKKMKTAIKPEESGINIKKIRKTKEGNVFVEMMKGDGQAKKLETALKSSLGTDLQVKTLADKFHIDIRDMEESTDADEIIQSILKVTKETDATKFKVKNIRDSYGGTKQALVELPANHAIAILKNKKIRIGLVVCRVREKTFAKRCFRCLELGHLARLCQGKDRSQICMRCGINGHKVRECRNNPRCVICLEAGSRNVNHYIGSEAACGNKNAS